jgi:hypothetical protein
MWNYIPTKYYTVFEHKKENIPSATFDVEINMT